MILPPTFVSETSLVSLRKSGTLQILQLAPRGTVRASSYVVSGWPKGSDPVGIRPSTTKNLFVVLADTKGGAAISLLLVRSGRASIVQRVETHEWFASIEAGQAKDSFYMPQGWGEAGIFHVSQGRTIVWDRLPRSRRPLADRTVLGNVAKADPRPFWLSVFSMSDTTYFTGYELREGRAAPISGDRNPILSITAIAAWRAGEEYAVLENGGRVFRFRKGSSRAEPTASRVQESILFAFAGCRRRPVALVAGENRAILLRRTGTFGWSKTTACAIGRSDMNGSTAAIDDRGRWGVVVTGDGTAHVLRIEGNAKMRLVRELPEYASAYTFV